MMRFAYPVHSHERDPKYLIHDCYVRNWKAWFFLRGQSFINRHCFEWIGMNLSQHLKLEDLK